MTELEEMVLKYLWGLAARGDNYAKQLAMSMETELEDDDDE